MFYATLVAGKEEKMSANFSPSLEPYKVTGSFKFWVQHVLPLVYDDSLSYYELLCKVVKYLNDVISNVDGLKIDIDKLLEAYNELQDYVNHYFDNLDIQAEVDKKLDEMVEDGTLSSIINEELLGGLNQKIDQIENDVSQINTKIPALEDNIESIENEVTEYKDEMGRKVRSYKSEEKGWLVTIVDGYAYVHQKFTENVNTESLLFGENAIARITPKMKRILPLPFAESDATGCIDSYFGTVTNMQTISGCTASYRHIYFDDSAPSDGNIKVAASYQYMGRIANPNANPQQAIGEKRFEVRDVALSYFNTVAKGRKWSYGANFVTYASSNVVNDSTGAGKMECDSLVALVMMGIPYESSPYANETPNYTYDFNNITPNPNSYTWTLPWKSDDTLGRKVTYTGGENWYLWSKGYTFSDIAQVNTGDIAIFTKPTSRYFDGISHIGICIIQNERDLYLCHFTGLSGVDSPMRFEPFEDVVERGGYTMDDIYFARPPYN